MDSKHSYKIFSIISEPRTGSNYLVSVLTANNDVVCHAEVFHPDKIYIKLPKDEIPNKQQRDESPESFLETVMDLTYIKHDKPNLIGFKYFFDHCSKIKDYILTNKVPVLLLERRDKLGQYSSVKIANKTEQWTSKQQSENPNMDRRVKFSLLEYLLFVSRSKYRFYSTEKLLKNNNVPYLYIYYEDIVKAEGVDAVYDFLNIDASTASHEGFYKKQNTNDIYERFTNPRYASFVLNLLSKFI